MRHHLYNPEYQFVREPEEFNKHSDLEFLRFCPGATMYMPGTKDFTDKIINSALPGLTTMVMCFEDACKEEDVPKAEENVHQLLENIADAIDEGRLDERKVPLIFCRVRSQQQFESFASKLNSKQVKVLAGINFPKFNSKNGRDYLEYLKRLNEKFGDVLYGMPILEDPNVAFKETRMDELLRIRTLLQEYKSLILQVRVGATDFSSCFGVRRGIDYTIYDILTVRECLSDILNVFSRNNEYVISGPVWEYFRVSKQMMFDRLPKHDLEDCLLKRIPIVNNEIDGLLREVILDKANGFVGRTVIHPTHIKYVNALQAVTIEEYEDACQILKNGTGGVFKGYGNNKMNEVKPHLNWAYRVYMRARAFGVIDSENSYIELFAVGE